jgi:uncharacterized protein YciI
MKNSLLCLLTFTFLATMISCDNDGMEANDDEKTIPTKEEVNQAPRYDSLKAASYGADDYGMRKYVMAFLKAGPNRETDSTRAAELQAAHMKNIKRLAEEGKLVLAGPFFGDGELRGIYLFDTQSLEEAEALTNTDPAIQSGSLVLELREWYGSAAIMELPQTHETIAKIKM